jgi:hypothetical protein
MAFEYAKSIIKNRSNEPFLWNYFYKYYFFYFLGLQFK